MGHSYFGRRAAAAAYLLAITATPVWAAMLDQRTVDGLTANFKSSTPAISPAVSMSIDEGYAAQDMFIVGTVPPDAALAGYKIGLTSGPSQEMFGVDEPVAGRMFTSMFLADGASVSARFGARPVFEADLVVMVKDAGVNDARTPLDVARHLSQVGAFIELPDLLVAKGQRLDGPLIAAINVGARYGVIGDTVAVEPTAEFVDALADMTVTLSDQNDEELARSKGAAILGHPLNAVVWLADHLKARGQQLRPNQIISLGSLTRPMPPTAGQTITASYDGLPGGTLEASVSFD